LVGLVEMLTGPVQQLRGLAAGASLGIVVEGASKVVVIVRVVRVQLDGLRLLLDRRLVEPFCLFALPPLRQCVQGRSPDGQGSIIVGLHRKDLLGLLTRPPEVPFGYLLAIVMCLVHELTG